MGDLISDFYDAHSVLLRTRLHALPRQLKRAFTDVYQATKRAMDIGDGYERQRDKHRKAEHLHALELHVIAAECA